MHVPRGGGGIGLWSCTSIAVGTSFDSFKCFELKNDRSPETSSSLKESLLESGCSVALEVPLNVAEALHVQGRSRQPYPTYVQHLLSLIILEMAAPSDPAMATVGSSHQSFGIDSDPSVDFFSEVDRLSRTSEFAADQGLASPPVDSADVDADFERFVNISSLSSPGPESLDPSISCLVGMTPRSMPSADNDSRSIRKPFDPRHSDYSSVHIQPWYPKSDQPPYTPRIMNEKLCIDSGPPKMAYLATPSTSSPYQLHDSSPKHPHVSFQSLNPQPRLEVQSPPDHEDGVASGGVPASADVDQSLLPPQFASPTITFQDYSTHDSGVTQVTHLEQQIGVVEDETRLSVYHAEDVSTISASSTEGSQVDFNPVPRGKRRASEGAERDEFSTGVAGFPPTLRSITLGEVPSLSEPGNPMQMAKVKREVRDWLDRQPDQVVKPAALAEEAPASDSQLRDRTQSLGGGLPTQEGDTIEDDGLEKLRQINTVPASTAFTARPLYPWIDRDRYIEDGNDVQHHPLSSAAAMAKLWQESLQFDQLSRVATWGTRRKSEGEIQNLMGPRGLFRRLLLNRKDSNEPKARKHSKRASLSGLEEKVRNVLPRRRSTKRKSSRKDSATSSQSAGSPVESRVSSQRSSIRRTLSPHTPIIATAGLLIASSDNLMNGGSEPGLEDQSLIHQSSGIIERVSSMFSRANSRRRTSDTGKTSPSGMEITDRAMSRVTSTNSLHGLQSNSNQATTSNLSVKFEQGDEEEDDEDNRSSHGLEDDREIEWNGNFYELDAALRAHISTLNPNLEPELLSRFSIRQRARLEVLWESRRQHDLLVMGGQCRNLRHCIRQRGQSYPLSNRSGSLTPQEPSTDREPPTTYPTYMTLPPIAAPAEFECPLCFTIKRCIKPSDWTKHVQEDLQPFQCTFAECGKAQAFKRKADWVRHENETHRKLEEWQCDMDISCVEKRHTCYRKDNFLQHLVREHRMKEPRLRARKGETKVVDLEAQKTLDKLEECHRLTDADPKNEACTFCGRRFDNWKKLTGHLARHQEQFAFPLLRLIEREFAATDSPQMAANAIQNPNSSPQFGYVPQACERTRAPPLLQSASHPQAGGQSEHYTEMGLMGVSRRDMPDSNVVVQVDGEGGGYGHDASQPEVARIQTWGQMDGAAQQRFGVRPETLVAQQFDIARMVAQEPRHHADYSGVQFYFDPVTRSYRPV